MEGQWGGLTSKDGEGWATAKGMEDSPGGGLVVSTLGGGAEHAMSVLTCLKRRHSLAEYLMCSHYEI